LKNLGRYLHSKGSGSDSLEYKLPYPKEVIRHFRNPKNVGIIRNADGAGEAGNLVCGDVMKLYIKVKKDKNGKRKISNIKFQTFGCIVAIGVSSMLTEIVKDKTIEEAIKITKDDVLKKSGPLPPIKVHCSVLAVDALHEAIYDYLSKNKLPIPQKLKKEHKRIVKTVKKLEKQHKEYLKLEKNILRK
jgi:nitrogen fixation NifU-like protein